MQSFIGKKALVIGGSGGIGAAICRELAKKGCSLVVHGGHDSCAFEELLFDLRKTVKARKLVQHLEVGFAKKIMTSSLIKSVKDADIVCICFGPFLQKQLHEMNVSDWENMAELNVLLPGVIISSALPQMLQNNWGRFLVIGGTRTERVNAFSTNAAYAACKTAVTSLVRSTALRYASHGITCNAVFPGFTKTKYIDEKLEGILAEKMPQRRLIETIEIAKMAVDLLEQPMVNGALVSMDGGWDPAF